MLTVFVQKVTAESLVLNARGHRQCPIFAAPGRARKDVGPTHRRGAESAEKY
jgi:hypothetical protein